MELLYKVDSISEENTFIHDGLIIIGGLVPGRYTTDEVRKECNLAGLSAPKPNLWGSLMAKARKKELLRPTGEWTMSKNPTNNGRWVRVHEKLEAV
jgi:hypothetical protein